jgi:metal-responsive CopG/Arc/MetJ family transcriptional regulator
MRLVKRTYVLPPGTLEEFERNVGAGERSAVVAQLLRDWLARRQREQLRQALIEGCREMAEVYREVEREYHPLEEEVQHALESESAPRRRRARPPRPRRGV